MSHLLGKRAANRALIPEKLSVKVYGHCVVCDGRTPCLGIAGSIVDSNSEVSRVVVYTLMFVYP